MSGTPVRVRDGLITRSRRSTRAPLICKKSLDRVRGVNRAHLDSGDQLNYDLYLDLLQTAVDGLRFHNDAMPVRFVTAGNLMMPVNQMGGVQQDVPRIISAMPTATQAGLREHHRPAAGDRHARRSDDRAHGARDRRRPHAAGDRHAGRAGPGGRADGRRPRAESPARGLPEVPAGDSRCGAGRADETGNGRVPSRSRARRSRNSATSLAHATCPPAVRRPRRPR